jgi:hypothetical protein
VTGQRIFLNRSLRFARHSSRIFLFRLILLSSNLNEELEFSTVLETLPAFLFLDPRDSFMYYTIELFLLAKVMWSSQNERLTVRSNISVLSILSQQTRCSVWRSVSTFAISDINCWEVSCHSKTQCVSHPHPSLSLLRYTPLSTLQFERMDRWE